MSILGNLIGQVMRADTIDNLIMIAHRGNINGPQPHLENRPEYINRARDEGFYVEIDVWFEGETFLLGHDAPTYDVTQYFLQDERFLCHAKNLRAVEKLAEIKAHWFYHDKDDCTLTSKGWIWPFPYKRIEGSIMNQPEFAQKDNLKEAISEFLYHLEKFKPIGVCSDYVQALRNLRNG